ncbi:cell envelope integrity protein TolA [Photobacterium galatheae]|uniref:cell envelope integrity protein TolA n=1 Tax=Photobacterium galatheae TaxID=1654360 RepID=UPI0009DE0BA3|nr:cell envelope integrity protein TolA [Photobacterium galatheae]
MYQIIIENKLSSYENVHDKLSGNCHLKLHLSEKGQVNNIQIESGDGQICHRINDVIDEIGEFPMPLQPEVIEKLQMIRLTVRL